MVVGCQLVDHAAMIRLCSIHLIRVVAICIDMQLAVLPLNYKFRSTTAISVSFYCIKCCC